MIKRMALFMAAVAVISVITVFAQNWQHVAVLTTDVSPDETLLTVDSGTAIQPDRSIMVETRDGSFRESYRVKHVYDHHVLLTERLRNEFLAGSRIYQ
jgi:hypothetical protein